MTVQIALEWLDTLLRDEVRAMRERAALPLDELQGLYISDPQVDRALEGDNHSPSLSVPDEVDTDVLHQLAKQNATWARLQARLQLTSFDCAVLLMAIAPEADLRYEAIYAYLNNDVTRKWPTRDLAIRLFQKIAGTPDQASASLGMSASLFKSGVLVMTPSMNEHPAWRAGGFQANPVIVHALLGETGRNAGIAHLPPECTVEWVTLSKDDRTLPADIRHKIHQLPHLYPGTGPATDTPVLVFRGPTGSGKREAARLLAALADTPLITIDARSQLGRADRFEKLLNAALLHQLVHGSVIAIDGIDALHEEGVTASINIRALLAAVANAGAPIILLCNEELPGSALEASRTVEILFDVPDATTRSALWSYALHSDESASSREVQDLLASRFILTPGQIHRTVQSAADMQLVNNDAGEEATAQYLLDAARQQTRLALGALARRVDGRHTWDDLVLPETTALQVREIAAAIMTRSTVYETWGFAQRLSQGQGLKVLFSGASGTGKTMAASVVAREVGLDLYAIDLSGIVSKYIGETEKNLDRVFRAAHSANAILFFDECDALFGKRSEVKDAHDRYANIEVAYLLQKMESHPGAVILATNFSRNMDQAFARRMQYVVDFPLPNETHRERLWRGMFPAQVPMSGDVDFPFLARHFALAGGDIRNVALDAAFLAAQNGRVVTMQHVVRAMGRQMVKQGRTPSPTDFKHYFTFLSRDLP